MAARLPDLPIARWPEWALLDREVELLREPMPTARAAEAPGLSVLFPLLDAIHESAGTLRLLINRFAIRDAYVIARVVYETAINACFLLTDPAALSERAHRHAKQKALRSLERTIELAGDQVMSLKWDAADEILGDPANKKLIQEFTSKSGREITSWTPETVRERLETIDERFGREAALGLIYGLLLYRHASEIAHGTLFGALFAWGAMEPKGPPRAVEDIQAFRVEQGRLILMLIGFSLESLIRIAAGQLGRSELAVEAREARLAFSKRPRPDT